MRWAIKRFQADETDGRFRWRLQGATPWRYWWWSPRMIRPKQVTETRTLSPCERDALAERASYVGSHEHKMKRSWLGLPKAGSRIRKLKTTVCELVKDEDKCRATMWVQNAIRANQYKFVRGDKDFPKHVWYESDDQVWYGRCTNSVSGDYKGLSEEERRAIFD